MDYFPPDLRSAISLFAFQLETDAFPLCATDISTTFTQLQRLLALATHSDTTPPNSAIAALSALKAVLHTSNPCHSHLLSLSARAEALLRTAPSKKAAGAALAKLVASTVSARPRLIDNAVSVLAGGPVCRRILIQASTARTPGFCEEAAREAAAGMERLDILVAAPSATSRDAVATAARLRAVPGVGEVVVVALAGVAEALRGQRVHGVLLDAVAVGEAGVVVQSGARLLRTAARMEGVRVFACALAGSFIGGVDGEGECFEALKASKGHPGEIIAFKEAMSEERRVRVINPRWDVLKEVDVVVSENGASRLGKRGLAV